MLRNKRKLITIYKPNNKNKRESEWKMTKKEFKWKIKKDKNNNFIKKRQSRHNWLRKDKNIKKKKKYSKNFNH